MTDGEVVALAKSISRLCHGYHVDDIFAVLSYLLAFAIIEADGRHDCRMKILELHTDHVASQITAENLRRD